MLNTDTAIMNVTRTVAKVKAQEARILYIVDAGACCNRL